MSAIGTKRTYRVALHMSAFGAKADTAYLAVPSSGHPDMDKPAIFMRDRVDPRAECWHCDVGPIGNK